MGTITRRAPVRIAAPFAASIALPPPAAITTSACVLRAAAARASMAAAVHSPENGATVKASFAAVSGASMRSR